MSIVCCAATAAVPAAAPRFAGLRRVAGPAALNRDVEQPSAVSLQVSGRSNSRASRRCVATMAGTGRFVVGGNWKCNGNTASIQKLVQDLNAGEITADVEVICALPMIYLPRVQSTLDRKYQLSAQNCWVGEGGAFTGEVAAEMLMDNNIPWVILGHSERRALIGESDEFIGKKVAYAISKGLSVMACIGETLEERERGDTMNVCRRQLQAIVNCISPADWAKVVIAYEPVWAIGTGKVATPEQAQETHAGIRQYMAEAVSPAVASAVRIQYGGSVNAGNCEELARCEDIDGFLVGGASLDGAAFVTICNSARFNN
mmetsp:Transcript_698/g.2851  ORF Transcript_698/g.2851 Transcript_698/m.2851 type:complete len:316 (-) Transcript_698:224-1171(-)